MKDKVISASKLILLFMTTAIPLSLEMKILSLLPKIWLKQLLKLKVKLILDEITA